MVESTEGAGEPRSSPLTVALVGAGLAYLGLGAILGLVYFAGGVQSSLFPTGWLLPAVLLITGTLMALRRRFDIVGTLWGGLALAVFLLDVLVHVSALDLGLDDPGAFDATLIVAAFGFVPLLLRPQFRE